MKINSQLQERISVSTMAALMLSIFVVSVGFGAMLPILPYLIEWLLGSGVEVTQVSLHMGILAAVYTFSLFLFAPIWGRLSDRHSPRGLLLVGLLGFATTMLSFSFFESLPALYGERFLSGAFAAAVTPITAATIGNFNTTEHGRARRFSFLSMASIAGFLLGPLLGAFAMRIATKFFFFSQPTKSFAIAMAATASIAVLVAILVAFTLPNVKGYALPKKPVYVPESKTAWAMTKMLILTFIVSSSVAVFEVGLALHGKQELGLTSGQIALMYTECSVVMFAMQAIVFSPWFKPKMTRWLIAPALSVLAVGLFFIPRAISFYPMLMVIGAVAASAGLLSPILTYWISAMAGRAQGFELGKQAASSSLGVTLGSAAGGLLYSITALPGASFMLTAGLVSLGFLLSLRLPYLLSETGNMISMSKKR